MIAHDLLFRNDVSHLHYPVQPHTEKGLFLGLSHFLIPQKLSQRAVIKPSVLRMWYLDWTQMAGGRSVVNRWVVVPFEDSTDLTIWPISKLLLATTVSGI